MTPYYASFTVHVQAESGEQSWSCIAELIHEDGRFYFDRFEARCNGVEFDDTTDFLNYCRSADGSRPDLKGMACDALVREAEG